MVKVGYKIIIAGLVIYGGIKLKGQMDVSPYKDSATDFMNLIKEKDIFNIYDRLSTPLKNSVSIENISDAIEDLNLSDSVSIKWTDWRKKDDNYTIYGVAIKNKKTLALKLTLHSLDENKITVNLIEIGNKAFFRSNTHKKERFLE